ncbi:MAG: hypothetical protein JST54_00040 [Deltaproteobacteria bacterium]|nr:hypothetical protein [Deltaproteobacteria bacterium]
MIAMVILAVGGLAALSGLMAASHDLHDGQLRQFKAALAEQRTQLLMMTDKTTLTTTPTIFGTPQGFPAGGPASKALGASPWQLDPQGAFFSVSEDGIIVPASGNGATNCGSSSLPNGTFCREIALITTLPDGSTPPSGTPYTLWTRVIRGGDPSPPSNPSLYAVVERMVVVQ